MVIDMKKKIYMIKRFMWLCAVFIIRIVFAKNKYKISRIKTLYFNFHGGFTANQVALYDLTKENKKEYLSEFDWYKSRRINYPNGYKLDNKLICVDLIKDYINTPITYLTKENGHINSENKKITLNKALQILKEKENSYFKPVSEGKGNNVFRIDYKENNFYINFKKVSENKIRKILKEKDNYFLSSCINQADYLNKIYNKTSNTIRLITTKENGKFKIIFAVQRIGTKNTIPVDNGSQGGLVAKIDLKTGKLSEAKCMYKKETYKKHPDSGGKIEGVTVPNWEMIKEKMLEVSSKLEDFKFIAWDLLITNNDIYVLEANNSSGVNIIQLFGPQRQNSLGNFYRQEKVIK